MVLVSSVTKVKIGCWERVKVTTPATESREGLSGEGADGAPDSRGD